MKPTMMPSAKFHARKTGFSLVEMAIVLLIVALLLGGLLPTLSGQMEQQRTNETRKQLDEVQQALLGFAIVNGRLPCPASSTSNGQESINKINVSTAVATSITAATITTSAAHGLTAGNYETIFNVVSTGPGTYNGTFEVSSVPTTTTFIVSNVTLPGTYTSGGTIRNGNCTNFFDGFVPAAALGILPVDAQGYMLDGWNNRIRYAVTSWSKTTTPAFNNVFTTASGMSTVGIFSLSPNYLLVCSTATTSSTSCSVANSSLTSDGVPAVVYSLGKNGGYGGTGTDEFANPNPKSTNNDRVFVSHTPTPSTATNGEFDDLVIWLSPNILFNRMVAAGRLP